jgi:alpha-1,3-rhamnosyl/mannosyltransferase
VRVALDAQLTIGTATGIGEYVAGLQPALVAAGVDAIALSSAFLDPWRFDRRVVWDQIGLPLATLRAHVDLLHCTSGTMPLVCPRPVVTTVHDVAWLRVQQHARPYARAYFGRFALGRYAHARRIIVDSHFSRAELLALGPFDAGRVEVVYPGVASDVRELVRRPSQQPALLAVGTVEARKNLAVVVRALAALPGVRLIVAGPATPYRLECERIARECGVAERVSFAGYVSRPELLALYATATAAVVPSRYEGFGYGAAQALCAGVPLVAANASSLPEVVEGAAPLLDCDDVAAWSAALAAILADPAAAEVRAAAARPRALERFAWKAAAEATAGVYRRALGSAQ